MKDILRKLLQNIDKVPIVLQNESIIEVLSAPAFDAFPCSNIKINLVDLGPNFRKTDIRGYERSYNKKITNDWLMESSFSSHLNNANFYICGLLL